VKYNKGNVFVFSKLIMTENENSDKVNGKLFFIIKSGSGFMGSLMHSLIKDRDFYFRALRSLVVLSFPQPLSFSSVFPKPLSETLTRSSDRRNPVKLTVGW
jgi:hypothetical protein